MTKDFEKAVDGLQGNWGKKIAGLIGIVLLVIVLAGAGKIIENVDANDILVIKAMGTGKLSVYTTPGWKPQFFGEATHFKKSYQYWFSAKADQGKKTDQSIRARFNDNGHGNISGSVRIDSPLDTKHVIEVYTRYGTQEAVEHDLVRTVFEKAVYMTGPLMSSTESASTKRNMLISYIEDQAQNGVYRTQTRDIKTKDPITGAEKTVSIVEVIHDDKSPNQIARQEESPLQVYGFKTSNLSINEVTYDKEVEGQISAQQKAIMDVQIAMAESKKAEQRALTVAKEGEATAAKAKWEQEAIKARLVTEAEQKRDVAQLEMKAAEFKKQALILEGTGEAEKKRLIMAADGALEKKLDTYQKVMSKFAEEFAKQKWVPEVSMGATSAHGGEAVSTMMNLLSMQALKSLGLDMSVPTGKTPPPAAKK